MRRCVRMCKRTAILPPSQRVGIENGQTNHGTWSAALTCGVFRLYFQSKNICTRYVIAISESRKWLKTAVREGDLGNLISRIRVRSIGVNRWRREVIQAQFWMSHYALLDILQSFGSFSFRPIINFSQSSEHIWGRSESTSDERLLKVVTFLKKSGIYNNILPLRSDGFIGTCLPRVSHKDNARNPNNPLKNKTQNFPWIWAAWRPVIMYCKFRTEWVNFDGVAGGRYDLTSNATLADAENICFSRALAQKTQKNKSIPASAEQLEALGRDVTAVGQIKGTKWSTHVLEYNRHYIRYRSGVIFSNILDLSSRNVLSRRPERRRFRV